MAKKLNYSSTNFADTRQDLLNFVRQYYPDLISDFNDSAVSSMLIELMAGVGDLLQYSINHSFTETQIDYAQERKSMMAIARTLGTKIPGNRPSITLVDFSVTVPVEFSSNQSMSPDLNYGPTITKGAQVSGAGKIFETLDDINFWSSFTTGGIPNRTIVPNIDSNNKIQSYTITKREIVLNGITKIYQRTINQADIKPFFEIILPDSDILSVESVITLEGTNLTNTPTQSDFSNFNNRWFEVPSLPEDKIFIEDPTGNTDLTNSGIKFGKYVNVDQRFITEFTDNGFLKLIFGSGTQDISNLTQFGVSDSFTTMIGDFINNLSLGITPTANQTMYVQYRVGGGSSTNIGPNTLTSLGLVDINVNGPDTQKNLAVQTSLTVNNPISALGGRDVPSVDEIRYILKYNFASQNRCVTIKDYMSRIALMPGDFGVPFRSGVYEDQNKIEIAILGLDANGNLDNSSTDTLKTNIAEYLSDYRILNDYIEVIDGQIINLGFEVDLFIDKSFGQTQIINSVINAISSYMDISTHVMGENIYLGPLYKEINDLGGVLNIVDLRVYNKVGNNVYSLNEISQGYIDSTTREIDITDQTLYCDSITMFEVLIPNNDITIRVKN